MLYEVITTIINAEDMLDIWDDLNVVVARIGKGEPESYNFV